MLMNNQKKPTTTNSNISNQEKDLMRFGHTISLSKCLISIIF